MMSKTGEIRRDDACLDYNGRDVILFSCHGGGGNQEWEYKHSSQTLRHPSSNKCIVLAEQKDKLIMEPCKDNSNYPRMRWKFQSVNGTKT